MSQGARATSYGLSSGLRSVQLRGVDSNPAATKQCRQADRTRTFDTGLPLEQPFERPEAFGDR